jgi:hypothetical protein
MIAEFLETIIMTQHSYKPKMVKQNIQKRMTNAAVT